MTEYPAATEYLQATTQTYTPQPDADSPPLKDKATDVAEAAKQAGTDVAQTAAEKAKDVVQETSKQARDLVGEAREQVRQQAAAQHHSLVTNLRSLANELDGMASGSGQSGMATEAVTQVRDRVHGAADWLEGREPGDLIDELRGLARRRPAAFLLGAAAAGVVAGRLTRGVVAVHADDAEATPKSAFASQNRASTQPSFAAAGEHRQGDGYASEYSEYAAPAQPGYATQPGYSTQPGYGTAPDGGYPHAGPSQSGQA